MAGLDRLLFRAVNGWPPSFDPWLTDFSVAHEWPAFRLTMGAIVVALVVLGHARTAILALVAFPLADGLCNLAKNLAPHHRPFQELPHVLMRVGFSDSMGTASSHAANLAAVATVMTLGLGLRWGAIWAARTRGADMARLDQRPPRRSMRTVGVGIVGRASLPKWTGPARSATRESLQRARTGMDEAPAERDRTAEAADRAGRLPSLSAAIRVARAEVADRAQALGDLRDAELARLELLREMIAPVLAQVPAGVDLFDAGLVPGEHPRLFIDMVAFVEMARDRRSYRLVQDRRHARTVLHEGEGVGAAVTAVTAYVARRLVEREQLLASLGREVPPDPAPPRRRPSRLLQGLRLLVDGLGVAALGALLWLGLHYASGRLPGW